MKLNKISQSNQREEAEIQKTINDTIDNLNNFIFDSGAGSGKTYALTESLRHIISIRSDVLSYNNQKILCITYTNVAANEIKSRIGHSDLVTISTIHDSLWDMIKPYQKQLVNIHKNKLQNELNHILYELNNNEEDKIEKIFRTYRQLPPDPKSNFTSIMLENKEKYYECYNLGAQDFRNEFSPLLCFENELLRNVGNFKKIVSSIYKIDNYSKCLQKIKNQEDKYTTIKYDARFNTDRLQYMYISHDTLLDYSLAIFSKYDLLKQIIINNYPYILIDEYQDTNPKVVEIINTLIHFADAHNQRLLVGYFGDTAQKIYGDGIGNIPQSNDIPFIQIKKEFNRRSHLEIIHVINKIRNDRITQKSIFRPASGGTCEFFAGTQNNIDSFVNKCITDWSITNNNKLHCLVLTNKNVAKYNNFEDLYELFNETDYYKKNFARLATELLSTEFSKLGEIPSILYRILELRNYLNNEQTFLSSLIKDFNVSIIELQNSLSELRSISGETLYEYIKSIFDLNVKTNNKLTREAIMSAINLDCDNFNFPAFISFLTDKLFSSTEDKSSKICELLNIDFTQYHSWFNYVSNIQNGDTIFHTYHGTKGEEYNNVLIIMSNDFGRTKNKFKKFFTQLITNQELQENEKNEFIDTKNLLYVSCSRAIKNLRIFYIANIEEFSEGIKEIFTNIQFYNI